jgi:hypothetical protein
MMRVNARLEAGTNLAQDALPGAKHRILSQLTIRCRSSSRHACMAVDTKDLPAAPQPDDDEVFERVV